MGTMVAVGAEGNLLDKDEAAQDSPDLIIDSLAAVAGGVGVSSNTST